jgi:hypothetical protein
MPKPITVTISVEELMFGKVWTTLDTMPGVISISIHGSGSKKAAVPRNGKQSGTATRECLILGYMIENKQPVNRDALYALLEKAGKARTSLPDALTILKKKKFITINKPNSKDTTYKITAAGRARYAAVCAAETGKE